MDNNSLTKLSPLPDKVNKYLHCKLLHERKNVWDGSYRYDDQSKNNIPDIRSICPICDKDK